jgi:hypothetical protein
VSYSDPALAMQKGTLSLMKAGATGVQTGGRIYDGVPGGAVKPYVSFGPFQMLPEHGDCLDGGEAFLTLDGWAAGPDTVQVKKLGAAIASDLDRAELVVDGQRLIELSIEQIQYMRDPDGITAHAVVTVHAWTEPVAVTETPPVNTELPGISGSPVVGAVLTASIGTWTGTEP